MTHVLHIYKTYFPDTQGGIEQFISTLTAATAKLGVSNTLLTASPAPQVNPNDLNHPLKVIQSRANFSIASCPFSRNFYDKFKQLSRQCSTIHVHFPWPFGELMTRLLSSRDHNIIITYHADITRQKYLKWLYFPMMQSLLKRADHIVATSPNLLNSSPILQAYHQKCSVIPLGVNIANYTLPDKTLQETWQQRIGDNFLLFIGQYRYYKGIEVLLHALAKTNVTCVLAGAGPLKPQAEQLAQHLKLKHIHFVGSVSEIEKIILLTLCRAVVLPSISRIEAFGLCLLEGLAFNKPLISTELGTGTSFVNKHGTTGLVVPPLDVTALAQAIETLFNDNLLYSKLQQSMESHFNQYFQLSQIAAQYQKLYN